ncbi:glycosyltransferase family 2 protein [Azospirillum doebereinerae]|uniref:Glycosyltransferase family 2 protein n=1 Tax=Azospirillum doebereinerae TaxID=92933 RepID=A0A3S0WSV9_9PROT|nr:glycosyltransferase family A protein [Azospirillum doebereinerae]MCG5239751.1 glycosyltransferase family 2 protein [Azospirillum doebereinerae]RUQ67143.1 glycosyltransferase family 2 protein [Azospirillum doebereinerae]
MPTFSIILPTLRQPLAEVAVRAILDASAGQSIEIVLVAPFALEHPCVRNVLETERRGNCSAHATGYEASTGDIIVAMSDDHLPLPGWLDGLAKRIEEREKLDFPFLGGMNRPDCPFFGTVYGLYYPYFPVLSRRSAEDVGGWFSRDYRAHFGDPDLAMRVWAMGGRCELLPGDHLLVNRDEDPDSQSDHKTGSLETDYATFLGKYHRAFGGRFPQQFRQINFDYHLSELRDGSFTVRLPPSVHGGRPHDWRG